MTAATLRDRGMTLVELLIAVVLSGLISGVVVAALITSLNVASSTTAEVNDSSDGGLISSYLARDAQSAGSTDPTTAKTDSTLGVSVDSSVAGWAGCTQPATMVVRFSWMDRASTTVATKVVVTYALDGLAQLTRRTCRGSTVTDVVLGRHVATATATCLPVALCTAVPTSVSLAVTGVGTRAPLTYTLTASLRRDVQGAPSTTNSSPIALVALGAPSTAAPCPNLTLSGTGNITIVGSAIVDGTCGAAPISGTQTVLKPTGTTSSIIGIVDPFVGRVAPTGVCSGTNPATIGLSASASTIVVYPQAVSITGSLTFQPGRYIFCAGLSMTGGTITGTNVLFYVAGGTLAVGTGANIDLTPSTTGTDANLLIWVATAQTITIDGGPRANIFRGLLYAPTSVVQLSSSLAASFGGVVAKNIVLQGAGAMRVGLPLPVVSISPATVPSGEVTIAYSTTLVASGGTSPSTWSATGLPAGLTLGSTTGVISGTPTVSGSFAIVVTNIDATAAAESMDYTLTVVPKLAIASPASLPSGQVGVAYASTTIVTSNGVAPVTWTASGLPPGLTINASTGVVSGTPTTVGTFAAATVVATDARAATASKVYSVSIVAAPGAVCPSSFAGWKGEYYSNATLTAPTSLCRDDSTLTFDWGSGSPAAGLPVDNFSVRWTRTASLPSGTYSFGLGTDDGGRLYIDGVLVLDRWVDQAYPSPVPTVNRTLTAGAHTFVVEYYERSGSARATLDVASS